MTTSASAAGTYSGPSRYRWVTRPRPLGSGLLTCRSVVPNARDRSPSEPATLTRRVVGCTAVTSRPRLVSSRLTRSTSAGSAPYPPPSSAWLSTVGPSMIAAGSSARRLSTIVISARSPVSTGAVSVTSGSDARSLPASCTKDPDSSGIV